MTTNTVITLRPAQLASLLARTIAANHAVLITGAPGIGKTQVVEQAARAAGNDLIVSHLAVADPTDANGLPWIASGADQATHLPFGDLAGAIKAAEPTVWFLDDLGQASPAVQAAYMQLLLARRINGHAISPKVTFVAATNRRTDRANVSGVLEPVKSRFTTIVELEASVDDFCAWAIAAGIDPRLIAFLRLRRELLHDFTPSADLTNSPCPRTWENVDKLLKLGLPEDLVYPAIAGAVGSGAATEFVGFLRIMSNMVKPDAVLLSPESAPIPSEPSALYAISAALAQLANDNNFGRIVKYCERMEKEGRGEFATLTIQDALRRTPGLDNSPAFVVAMSGPIGRLISGGF